MFCSLLLSLSSSLVMSFIFSFISCLLSLVSSLFVLSCLVLSCLVLSCLVLSCLVLSCLVLSCLVLSCLVLSCLVLSCLVLSCLVLSCLVLSCLVLSCLVLSCLVSLPSSCLVLFCLPSSLSLSVSLCFCLSLSLSLSLPSFSVSVWCGVSCCVVLSCLVMRCGVWGVSVQNVPCVPAPRAHVETHVRVVPACTGTFLMYTRGAWVRGGVCRQPRVFHRNKLVIFEHVEQHLKPMSGSCLIANFLLTKIGPRCYHLLERLTKVSTGSFPFSSLRIGREQHVLDSSNHSPHHFDIQSTARKSHCHGFSCRSPALVFEFLKHCTGITSCQHHFKPSWKKIHKKSSPTCPSTP